jgi:hypothetical protein
MIRFAKIVAFGHGAQRVNIGNRCDPVNTPYRPNVVGLTDADFDGVGAPDLRNWLDYWCNEDRSRAEAEAKGIDRREEIRKIQAEINARFADGRVRSRAREC